MSIFGWSYPPGCTSGPYDDEGYCEVCGRSVDNCICPECPVCGGYGDPVCYQEHGLVRTQEQIDGRAKLERIWEEERKADDVYEQAMKEVKP